MGLFSRWTDGGGGGPKPSARPLPQATPPRKPGVPSAPPASTGKAATPARVTLQPEPSRGTTTQEAVKARDIYDQAKGAKANSQEAVNLLQQMMEPGPVENATLDDIKGLLGDVVERLIALEDGLSRIEARLTGPRAVSPR